MPETEQKLPCSFRVLLRTFLFRVVDLEILSRDGDPVKLMGQIAALLAGASVFFCLPLLLNGGDWNENDLWTMEHLFIATTMLVAGLISILNWDSIFPDRRDIMVLGPLPVPSRKIFLAKLSAMACVLSISVIALNVFTGLLWPLYFSTSEGMLAVFRSFAAYWVTSLLAAAWMFFSVLAVQGILSHLLPRQIYLRISAFLQVVAVCLCIGVFIIEPTAVSLNVLHAHSTLQLPTFWFFGLFQQLNGSHAVVMSTTSALAHRASIGLLVAFCVGALTILFAYLRTTHSIVEAEDIQSSRNHPSWMAWPCVPLKRALLQFSMRTLIRSRSHRMIFGFYFGAGLAISMAYALASLAIEHGPHAWKFHFGGSGVFAAQMLMIIFAIGGLRILASIPAILPANWLFRITEMYSADEYLGSIRLTFVVLGFAPVWLASCAVSLLILPWHTAALHLVVLGILGLNLVEIALLRFRKIPFTCSYMPGRGNLQFVFWVCALLFLPLVSQASRWEMSALAHPILYAGTLALLILAYSGLRWRAALNLKGLDKMKFEEIASPEVAALGLNSH